MRKISLANIDNYLLPDFKEFDEANTDWDINKHLNFNYDINAAIAFSKLTKLFLKIGIRNLMEKLNR